MKITIESATVNLTLEAETLSELDLDYITGLLRGLRPVVYDVVLEDPGPRKIAAIKAVRVLAGIGLKEAKDLVESAPGAVVLSGVTETQASAAANELRNAGCTVKVQERS